MALTGHSLVYSADEPIGRVHVRHALRMLHRGVALVREPHPTGQVIGPYELPASVDLIRAIDRAVFAHTGTVPYSRRALFVRDRGRCCYCSQAGDMMDHVVLKSRGGTAAWTNAVVAWFACNQQKADRTPGEAGMVLLKPPFAPTWLDIYDLL